MRQSLILLACALTVACGDTVLAPSTDVPLQLAKGGNGKGGGGGGGPGAETPLSVTFDDASGGLTSDGDGAYVHDVDKVRAVLRSNGNLNFDAADIKGKKAPIRVVCVTVTDDVTGATLYPEDGEPACVDLQLNTNALFSGDVVLGEMAVGDLATTTGAAGWVLDGVGHKVRYGRRCGANESNFGTKMAVTRVSQDEWDLSGGSAFYCEDEVVISENARADFSVTLVTN